MRIIMIPVIIGELGTVPTDLEKNGGRNWKPGKEPSVHNSVKIGQNTEKSQVDLRRLAVTQTQVKDHQLTLV